MLVANAAVFGEAGPGKTPPQFAKGVVYYDANHNQKFDEGEKPIPSVRVSNGRDVVATDQAGRYQISVDDDTIVFVIKPSGWQTPLSKTNLPRFYYIHKPQGSPKSKYPGVPPTGPLPESIDFPLYPQDERQQFQAIVFGDPQTRGLQDVAYLAHDIVEELVGTKAVIGISLGDESFNDLSVLEPEAETVSVLGIPWFNVIGNHDSNDEAKDDRYSDETFERVIGPSHYSFNYASVHFIVLDDVECSRNAKNEWSCRGNIGRRQLDFIKNDLAGVPAEKLVVLMMHIPLIELDDRQEVYRLIENRPYCLSLSGHTHSHEQHFIDRSDGWRGAKPHHHIIQGAACGCWWNGCPDERGIPHSTMMDGTPNGYSIITFNGNQYTQEYKAAGRSKDYQMQVHAPDSVSASEVAKTRVLANVFNSSIRSTVKMRVDGGKWVAMKRAAVEDPAYRKAYEIDQKLKDNPWVDLPRPWRSTHIWSAALPADLHEGVHLIQVETTDINGKAYTGNRVIRVVVAKKS
jgi:hypothetical protein